MRLYGYTVPEEEWTTALGLGPRWSTLLFNARNVDRSLIDVKAQFKDVYHSVCYRVFLVFTIAFQTTKQQVEMYKKKVSKLSRNFQKAGPGSPGIDIEQGFELLKKFQKEFQRYNGIRFAFISCPEKVELNELQG